MLTRSSRLFWARRASLMSDPYAHLFADSEADTPADEATRRAYEELVSALNDSAMNGAPPGGTKQRHAGRVFKDRARFIARGGRGGDGSNSMAISRVARHTPPDGGPGGPGGSVVVVAAGDVDSLGHVPFVVAARTGGSGAKNNQYGGGGLESLVRVPLGTVVRLRKAAGQRPDESAPLQTVADLTDEGDRIMVARGGAGGRGNSAVSSGGKFREARPADYGGAGEEHEVVLELKLIADAGLVGEPNAGKSTLLSALTRATPKVGAYAFTTLTPYIGTIQYDDFLQLRVADLPGLLEGSHEDRGVGAAHLRHATRAAVLCIVVDVGSRDGVAGAVRQYRAMRHELAEWRKRVQSDVDELRDLPTAATSRDGAASIPSGSDWHGGRHVVLVGTKLDLIDERIDLLLLRTGVTRLAPSGMVAVAYEKARQLCVAALRKALRREPIDAVCGVSALDGWGIEALTAQLRQSCELSGRSLR